MCMGERVCVCVYVRMCISEYAFIDLWMHIEACVCVCACICGLVQLAKCARKHPVGFSDYNFGPKSVDRYIWYIRRWHFWPPNLGNVSVACRV